MLATYQPLIEERSRVADRPSDRIPESIKADQHHFFRVVLADEKIRAPTLLCENHPQAAWDPKCDHHMTVGRCAMWQISLFSAFVIDPLHHHDVLIIVNDPIAEHWAVAMRSSE
jgi:hypothetical protein